MKLVLQDLLDDSHSRAAGRTAGMMVWVVAANVGVWGAAWFAFAERPALFGAALLAYLFGLRHGVDADHIAAIDNVVRKLMHDGKRPIGAGLFFSLGHSTVVFLAAAAVAVAAYAVQDRFEFLKSIGGVVGASVSAAF